jgi:biopolymer transport protein ExbD
VLIAADANSRSGSLVRVLDACRQAGLSDLNLSGSTEQER